MSCKLLLLVLCQKKNTQQQQRDMYKHFYVANTHKHKAKLRLQFSVIVLSVTHLPIYCFSSLRPTINNTIIASDCCLFYELYVFIYIYICDENGGESGMYSIFSALTDCALKHRILYFILFGVIFCAKAKPFLKYYILIYKSSVYC